MNNLNKKLNTHLLIKLLLLVAVYACASNNKKQDPINNDPVQSELLIIDKTGNERMKKLVAVSNCVINKKSFQDELKSIENFTNIEENGEHVLNKILKSKQGFVNFYTQNWFAYKFTPVHGYVNNGSDQIYINTRTFGRENKSVVNTIVHEMSHVAGYKHQGNSPKGNQESVPYKVGSVAENNVEGCL